MKVHQSSQQPQQQVIHPYSGFNNDSNSNLYRNRTISTIPRYNRNHNNNNNNTSTSAWGNSSFTFNPVPRPQTAFQNLSNAFHQPARSNPMNRFLTNIQPVRFSGFNDLTSYPMRANRNNNRNGIINNNNTRPIIPRRRPIIPHSPASTTDSDEDSDNDYGRYNINKNTNIDISKWTANDIYEWILSLDRQRFSKYKDLKQKITDAELTGNDLKDVTEDNIMKDFGIKKFSDKKLLYSKIQSILPKDVKEAKNKKTTKKEVDEEDIPEQFLDPITYELMEDPVLCSKSGHTYERKTIEDWIESNGADPITRQKIKKKHLTPNRTLKELIQAWKKENKTKE